MVDYALHLLKNELLKEEEKQKRCEKSIGEGWNNKAYAEFCEAVERIPSLKKAIERLENRGFQPG